MNSSRRRATDCVRISQWWLSVWSTHQNVMPYQTIGTKLRLLKWPNINFIFMTLPDKLLIHREGPRWSSTHTWSQDRPKELTLCSKSQMRMADNWGNMSWWDTHTHTHTWHGYNKQDIFALKGTSLGLTVFVWRKNIWITPTQWLFVWNGQPRINSFSEDCEW